LPVQLPAAFQGPLLPLLPKISVLLTLSANTGLR
jgi:hypothetical protein